MERDSRLPARLAGLRAAERIVTRNKLPWATLAIVAPELFPAAASADDDRVGLSWRSQALVLTTMLRAVVRQGRLNFDILWPIIVLDAVLVMHLLSELEATTNDLLGHKPMFIDVAADICKMVVGHLEQHVTVGSHCSSTAPVGVS